MKVVVTGRGGQLVRCLLDRAATHRGIDVVALGRPELDLERPDSLAEPILRAAPDVVINAAAYTAVDQAEAEADRAHVVNADAAGAIAAAAAASAAAIIQISTDYVFNGRSKFPYVEEDAVDPLGVYGRTKLQAEEQVRAATPNHVIVRTAWVYSPYGRNFVRTMMNLAQSRDTVSVVADQHGNPSSAHDLADGLLGLLGRWAAGERTGLGEAYHLAGTGDATWFDFAKSIFFECARRGFPSARVHPIATADWPTPAQRPANSRLSCAKFARDFGYRMPQWRDSVGSVVQQIGAAAAAA